MAIGYLALILLRNTLTVIALCFVSLSRYLGAFSHRSLNIARCWSSVISGTRTLESILVGVVMLNVSFDNCALLLTFRLSTDVMAGQSSVHILEMIRSCCQFLRLLKRRSWRGTSDLYRNVGLHLAIGLTILLAMYVLQVLRCGMHLSMLQALRTIVAVLSARKNTLRTNQRKPLPNQVHERSKCNQLPSYHLTLTELLTPWFSATRLLLGIVRV